MCSQQLILVRVGYLLVRKFIYRKDSLHAFSLTKLATHLLPFFAISTAFSSMSFIVYSDYIPFVNTNNLSFELN